jgi:aminoglycoside phosphotransferase
MSLAPPGWDLAPPQVRTRLHELAAGLGPLEQVIEPDRGHAWIATTPDHVIYLVRGAATRRRVDLEERRRRWAESQGLPQPPVVARGEDHLVVRRLPQDPPVGRQYLELAVDLADRIASASVPDELLEASTDRRASRRGIGRRLARLVRSGLPLREFKQAQRAAFALEATALAHGDFHPGNLLYSSAERRLVAIDWEYLGPAPPHSDLLTLWVHLPQPADRAWLVEHVLAAGADPRAVAVQQRWYVYRHLGDLVAGTPVAGWDRAAIRRARALLDEVLAV